VRRLLETSAMAITPTTRRARRLWLLLIPCLMAGIGLWYASDALAYATSLRAFAVPTGSMSPTIVPGDRIAVETRLGTTPSRGEIWVMTIPGGATAVKRVIGLPGERIEVSGGRVLIDGKALVEPYLNAPISYAMSPVALAADEYFMMGDRRNHSHDSHVWGPLPKRQLIGRVDYRYWPAARAGKLK
jgi:signal peptidase I